MIVVSLLLISRIFSNLAVKLLNSGFVEMVQIRRFLQNCTDYFPKTIRSSYSLECGLSHDSDLVCGDFADFEKFDFKAVKLRFHLNSACTLVSSDF